MRFLRVHLGRSGAGFSAAIVFVSACGTPLPSWEPSGTGSAFDASFEPRWSFDPPASRDAVSRVTRLRLELGQALAEPRVLLVEGVVSPAQLRDLARPAPSQALLARAEPALVWTSPPAAIVVAPLRVLVAGATYTLAVSEPPIALSLTVASDDILPILARVWPDPDDANAASSAAVWCAADTVFARAVDAVLEPAAIAGQLRHGTGTALGVPHCVSWFPRAAVELADAAYEAALPAVTPPWIALEGEGTALLEPAVLWPNARVALPTPVSCGATEKRLGAACAAVLDDRIIVRPPDRAMFWTISDGATSFVRRTRAERPFVIRPLPAERRFHVATLDESGLRAEHELAFDPLPPRSHVVINEVMANPAGAERTQEWVELYNDGLTAIPLGGYALETGAASTVLPAGLLAPGAFALVVSPGFVEDDGVDPVPTPGTLVLPVSSLGSGGLSNDGERLALRDAAGNVISTFPALKSKNGVSNARTAPDAPDTSADSFAPSPSGSATPGAPNVAP